MIASRLLFSIVILGFAFGIVLVSALRLSQPDIFGKQLATSTLSVEDTLTTQSQQDLLELLPHPGLLPNHPLYWIKMIRDRILLETTRDFEAQFYLLVLYADKRLAAGHTLITQNQPELGLSTITKAEKYLLQAHSHLRSQTDSSTEHTELWKSLAKSFWIHHQIMEDLKNHLNDAQREVLAEALEINQDILEGDLKPFQPSSVIEPNPSQ